MTWHRVLPIVWWLTRSLGEWKVESCQRNKFPLGLEGHPAFSVKPCQIKNVELPAVVTPLVAREQLKEAFITEHKMHNSVCLAGPSRDRKTEKVRQTNKYLVLNLTVRQAGYLINQEGEEKDFMPVHPLIFWLPFLVITWASTLRS